MSNIAQNVLYVTIGWSVCWLFQTRHRPSWRRFGSLCSLRLSVGSLLSISYWAWMMEMLKRLTIVPSRHSRQVGPLCEVRRPCLGKILDCHSLLLSIISFVARQSALCSRFLTIDKKCGAASGDKVMPHEFREWKKKTSTGICTSHNKMKTVFDNMPSCSLFYTAEWDVIV